MQVPIDEIKIKKRVRKDLGDLEDLKFSLNRYGLLNPITINANYELVAGHRRLEAAKALGWTEIEAIMINTRDKLTLLEIELEENNQRKAFTDSELLAGLETLKKLRNPSFFARIKMKFSEFFQKHFDEKEQKKTGKRVRNALLSLLIIVGLGIIVAGAILFTHKFITSALHAVMDIVGFIVIVIGVFFLVKFIIGLKHSKK